MTRSILLALLVVPALTQGAETPATHQIEVSGIIQAVDLPRGAVRLETTRRTITVTLTPATIVRLPDGQGQPGDLKPGQAASCITHWVDGTLQCQRLTVMGSAR